MMSLAQTEVLQIMHTVDLAILHLKSPRNHPRPVSNFKRVKIDGVSVNETILYNL